MNAEELFRYSDRCRRLMQSTIESNVELFDRPFETLSRFRTVRMQLAHIAAAEERWIKHRIRGEQFTWFEDRAPETIAEFFEAVDDIREETWRFLKACKASDLVNVVKFRLQESFEGECTIEQILFHIINHETHHRGQALLALMQFGVDVPDFDFVFHYK